MSNKNGKYLESKAYPKLITAGCHHKDLKSLETRSISRCYGTMPELPEVVGRCDNLDLIITIQKICHLTQFLKEFRQLVPN